VEGGAWFVVRRDTGEVVVNRSLMSLEHNQQLQLLVEARDGGMLLMISLPRTVTYIKSSNINLNIHL